MARSNSGKSAEQEFETVWARMGKKAWCFRLADRAEIFGRNQGRGGNTRSQPSDYVLVVNGLTSFAEVKSSQDATAFRFSMLRTKQSAMAAQILAAGGCYWVYVKAIATGAWYRLPYELIQAAKTSGKASIPWTQLEYLRCFQT